MADLLLSVFLFSVLVIAVLVTYPFFAYVRARYTKKPVKRAESFSPPVSIIIASYNEEKLIRDKLMFFLSEEEWIPGSEIIVVSAGSTDNTNKILAEFDHFPGFTSIIIAEHLAKPLALNRAVAKARHAILIFSDCRQVIGSGAVRALVSYFNDPEIGVVNSTLSDTTRKGKRSFIRSVLNSICINESISGSSLNIHGALYAQRKQVFVEFPDDILFDDLFAIVSTISQKKRLVQTREALITDVPFEVYYNKNRLERLARGLLIFLFRYWKDIKKLPTALIIRFLLYRYLKLLLPYLFLGLAVPLLFYVYSSFSTKNLLAFLLFLILLLCCRPLRNSVLLHIRINYCFMSSTFKYIFLKQRDTKWEKLNPEQAVF